MKPRPFQRAGLKMSLTLHAIVLALVLILPLFTRACNRHKPNEQLTFVEFTVSLPPPPAPETPPAPEPPKPTPPPPDPDEIKAPNPVKSTDPTPPAPPKPPKDIRQTNRIVRKDFQAPPPKDKPLSEAEIARLLKMGAKISDTTSVPDDSQIALGAYYNHVHERMYAVWQQPGQLKNLPGLRTEVTINVAPDGRITARRKTRPSGNDLMDDSVMSAVNSIPALRPLPVGHRKPVDIAILFEIGD